MNSENNDAPSNKLNNNLYKNNLFHKSKCR